MKPYFSDTNKNHITGTTEADAEVTFNAEAGAEMELYIDGVLQGTGNGSLCTMCNMTKGTHPVAVRLFHKADQCTFKAQAEGANLALPACMKNVKGQWLYLDSADEKAKNGFDKYQLYEGYEPVTNDTHGTGIVLIALIEVEKNGRHN